WLDKRLGFNYPWFTVIFLVFGVIAGFRNVYIIMKRIQKEEKERGL
ncbi:MAG: AtpZ/AtpI family protein, partial [Candidatus Desulfofervidaceae bacterium]|nr:AtpZ/AtpI family protein [Candidatus Desulfofervidaceae bacterium]